MRIALATDLYGPALLPDEIPTAARSERVPYGGTFVRELAHAIAAAGPDVTVLVPVRYFVSLRRLLKTWRELRSLKPLVRRGVMEERFAFWAYRGECHHPLLTGFNVRGETRALGRLLDVSERPDLLHAYFLSPIGYAVARVARAKGIPYIIGIYESQLDEFMRWPHLRRMARRAIAGAARVTVPGPFQRSRLLRHFPGLAGKTAIVSNGVDPARFHPGPPRPPGGAARLAYVGNLAEVKDPFTLLAGARALAASGFEFELNIAGEGHLRPVLEKEARTLAGRVRFLGAFGRDEVASLLRDRTDIFVLASRIDTFPNVLLEALASGVPVVATRCGGAEDILTDEVGRLVPVGDAEALAAAVREVWERRAEFPPERVAAYARERFAYDRVAAQFIALYQEILREQAS